MGDQAMPQAQALSIPREWGCQSAAVARLGVAQQGTSWGAPCAPPQKQTNGRGLRCVTAQYQKSSERVPFG